MIFSNVKYADIYCKMDDKINKCIKYIENTDLMSFSKGIHEIEGKEFFLNMCEYNSKNHEEGHWEAHRDYLDIHFMIKGSERIKLNTIDNLIIKNYSKDSDFVSFEQGESKSCVDLNEGDFLVCYPHDVHMTALKVNESEYVKKAIFKLKL